jgi:hypothetical protein
LGLKRSKHAFFEAMSQGGDIAGKERLHKMGDTCHKGEKHKKGLNTLLRIKVYFLFCLINLFTKTFSN